MMMFMGTNRPQWQMYQRSVSKVNVMHQCI